jgi:hypothetical protein
LTLTFSTVAPVTAGTVYWLVLLFQGQAGDVIYYNGSATGTTKDTPDDPSDPTAAWSAETYAPYFKAYASTVSTAVVGIYDFRTGSTLARQQMVVIDGNIYKRDKTGSSFDATWTSLSSAFTVGQDYLSSFTALKDYAIVTNYAQAVPRIWDGSAAYMPILGYQATFSLTDSGAAGTIADGTYKILAVTALESGGYRASAEGSITMAGGGTQQIAVSSVAMDETGATDFGFGLAATATTWFMTAAGGSTYYKIPTANLSTAANPMANNTTSFNITATTSLTSANTLIEEYGLPQAYFTSQTAAPNGKYCATWQDFVVIAGTSTNPSRVWFSEQNAPLIWSTYGQIYGNFLEIDDGDGDVITGIFPWNGALYVSKQHSMHVIEFTGNATVPFQRRKLPGAIGALSGFTFKDIGMAFVFLSERGIAACYGSVTDLVPGMEDISTFFDPNDANKFNLAVTAFSTAGHSRVKSQVWFGVADTNSTNRDLVLVYDYKNKAFWLDNGISGNYFTEVGDANSFYSVWSGDYSGQVFQHESGTNDDGVAIDWYFTTPHLALGDPYGWKHGAQLYVAGDKQTTGTLSVDVFVDRSTTATKTLSFDMSKAAFQTGILAPIGVRFKTLQFKFRNSTLDVPVHIDAFGVYFTDSGAQV